jgi:hypothetical protein
MNWKTILKNTPDDINWEEITGETREYWKDWMRTEYEGWMRELRRNVEYAGNYFRIELRNQMGELMKKAHIHKGNNEIFEFAVIIKFIEEEIEPLLRDAISQKKRDRANKRRRRRR